KAIQDNAEDITRGVLHDLGNNPRTPAYHRLSPDELHRRVYDVYHNLGRWVGDKSDEPVEVSYADLDRKRRAEGVALSEVVYALMLVKHHLREYIRGSGMVDSPVELYQEEELNLLVG